MTAVLESVADNKAQWESTVETTSSHFDETGEQKYKIILPNGEELKVIKDWTDKEEARVRLKLDLLILPILAGCFFTLQLDRSNLGNALTSTLRKDLGLTSYQINVGNQLLYIGIVLCEIPSNYVLQKIGPTVWLSFQVLAWGIIALSQAFMKNYSQYLALRILLGIGESSFIPGSLYTLSKFYKRNELARRHIYFFLGNILASCLGGFIAGGIIKDLTGKNGWPGWKWLFFVEGLATIGAGFILGAFLPRSPEKTSSLLFPKFDIFSDRERLILRSRILLDDPVKALDIQKKITLRDIGNAVSKWRIWLHFLISATAIGPIIPIGTYLPTIIKNMGYTQFQANAMSTISSWICAVFLVSSAFTQDKYKPRAAALLIFSGLQSVFGIVLRAITTRHSNKLRFSMITVFSCFTSVCHLLNTSWVSVNATSPTERAVFLAIVIMAANCGGVYGAQIFQDNDAPYYPRGFLAILLLSIVLLLLVLLAFFQYKLANKKLESKYGPVQKAESRDQEKAETDIDHLNQDGYKLLIDLRESEKKQVVDRTELFRNFRYSP